jgi:carbonic anhydrase
MLAGIGILIALAQFHVLLGHSPYSSGPLNILHIMDSLKHLHWQPLAIGSLTIAIIVLWKKILPKIDAVLPGSLIAVVTTTLLAQYLHFDVQTVQIQTSSSLFKFQVSLPTLEQLPQVVLSAFVLLLVASAESLLCAIATDKLHSGPRANLDKELIGQGLGNMTSSLLGGLPITGVIVRSAANIASGAQSRLSAILHSIWILIFVLLASSYISLIPLSALSGLLIYVGIKLVKIDQIKHLKKYGDTSIYFATFFGVILFGLLNGILIGIALTIFKLLKDLGKLEFETATNETEYSIRIKGALTFVAAPQAYAFLSKLPNAKKIRLDFELTHLDLTGLEIIRDWKAQYEKTGGRVEKPNLDTWILK